MTLLEALQEIEDLKAKLRTQREAKEKAEKDLISFQRQFREEYPFAFFVKAEGRGWRINTRYHDSYWESRSLSDTEFMKRVQLDLTELLFKLMKEVEEKAE